MNLLLAIYTTYKTLKKNPEGFTLSLNNNPVTSGYCVAYKATQNSFGLFGLIRSVYHALHHNQVVGGWYNESNNKYYFDSISIFQNREEAIKAGRQEEQLAIFDLNSLSTIEL